jgi:cytochrome b561
MYLLIWVAFVEILIVLFPVIGTWLTYDLHLVIGVIVLGLAYLIFSRVRAIPCPDRIKRIIKATFGLAAFQALLGVALYGLLSVGVSGIAVDFINFFHVVVALAIITQASSSATAFDMWEEKEFTPEHQAGASASSKLG